MKWPIYKINDICKVSGGKRLPKGHQFVDSKTKHPYIRITDMSFDSLSTDALLYITEETFKHISRYTISKDDIYISIAGTIGYVGKIPEFIDGANLTENCAKLSEFSDEINMDYLLYYLRSPRGNGELLVRKGGASQPKLALERIKTVPVPVPPINIQSRIANILSAYDDLIQNNQKQIKLLEEAAMRLYKEWFVKLRFPGHENTKIVDGVPEGWEKLYIEDVCQTVGGGTPSTKVPSYYNNGTIPWVTPTDITRNDCLILLDTEKKITEEGLARSSAKMLPSETILMTSRASVGFFGISEQEVCTNQGFISCIPNNKNLMMFLLLNLMNRKDEIRQKAGGATYLEINKSTFRKFIVIKPDDTLLNEFQSITYTILKRISALKKQSDLLKQARDKLLPKLMNGDIEV